MFEEIKANSKRWFDLSLLKNEVFKDIIGYEGYYQISNYGRIKSLKRIANNNHIVNEKILTNHYDTKKYFIAHLCVNKNRRCFKVHRLVAQTFIPNPKNKPQVNHIDGNKENNKVNNLEWATNKENQIHAYKFGLSKGLKGVKSPHAKKVIQFDLKRNFIKEWNYIKEASEALNINNSKIGMCCKGERKTAGGYIWEYKL